MNRTDLACEIVEMEKSGNGFSLKKSRLGGVEITDITITKEGEKSVGKPSGRYVTLFCGDEAKNADEIIAAALSEFLPSGKILIAGLGNSEITPDSLGARTAGGVLATAHLKEYPVFAELKLREVSVISSGVLAQTGIESVEHIRAVAGLVKPVAVVVIDALACSETARLGRAVQITDTGISPGSGVGNNRSPLSKSVLGIDCIAVGLPTVIDFDNVQRGQKSAQMMVTPRNIDSIVRKYSKILAQALNRALNPNLTPSDIEIISSY